MNCNDLIEEINEGEALYLVSIADKDRFLEIVISKGGKAERDENVLDGKSSVVIKSILEDADRILPDYCTAFRISFDNPIAYQVLDESYTAFDDNQKIETGRLFAKLKNSSYLEFISNTTFADAFSEGFQHYLICTVEKIVDVIAAKKPKVERIEVRL